MVSFSLSVVVVKTVHFGRLSRTSLSAFLRLRLWTAWWS